jgi:hypothetical protein
MEMHFVKWSSVTVEKRLLQRTFEVRARITGGEASDLWRDGFERTARRRAEETGYALWVSAEVSFEGDAIIIEIRSEGREDAVYEEFDQIVVAANQAAEEALEAKREQEEKDNTEPRDAAVRKIQERLRSRAN